MLYVLKISFKKINIKQKADAIPFRFERGKTDERNIKPFVLFMLKKKALPNVRKRVKDV